MKLLAPGEKIGEFLVRIGALTEVQVEEILQIQKEIPGTMFGIIAIERDFINNEVLEAFVNAKKAQEGK